MFIFGPRTGQGQDHTSWRRHPLRPWGMAGGCSCIMTSLAGVGVGGEELGALWPGSHLRSSVQDPEPSLGAFSGHSPPKHHGSLWYGQGTQSRFLLLSSQRACPGLDARDTGEGG